MEESRRRRSCRRSRLFRRFGASRETEKNASRRDSRGSLDSRTPDRTRRRNPSFRGSDGAGRRESARRVSRFAKFFLAIERGSRMRFQSRARFFVWPKVQVSPSAAIARPVGAKLASLCERPTVYSWVQEARSFSCVCSESLANAGPCAPPARARHSAGSPRTARGTHDRDGSLGEGGTRGVREARSARVESPRRLSDFRA
jgi:hypothetical protein